MFFATAGIAFLDADWKETATAYDEDSDLTFVNNYSESETLVGFVIGGGVEMALSQNITFGAEYLYEHFGDFGSVAFGHNSNPAEVGRIDDFDMHSVRARISYKFGREEQHTPLK